MTTKIFAMACSLIIVALLASIVWAQVIQQQICDGLSGRTVGLGGAEYTVSPTSTLTRREASNAVQDYLIDNVPLPPEITIIDAAPIIKIEETGLTLTVGPGIGVDVQLLVTIIEDRPEDLQKAELYINENIAYTATRETGSIVDLQPNRSIASMTIFANPCNISSTELLIYDSTYAVVDRIRLDL